MRTPLFCLRQFPLPKIHQTPLTTHSRRLSNSMQANTCLKGARHVSDRIV
jgi:hypothetical protein